MIFQGLRHQRPLDFRNSFFPKIIFSRRPDKIVPARNKLPSRVSSQKRKGMSSAISGCRRRFRRHLSATPSFCEVAKKIDYRLNFAATLSYQDNSKSEEKNNFFSFFSCSFGYLKRILNKDCNNRMNTKTLIEK